MAAQKPQPAPKKPAKPASLQVVLRYRNVPYPEGLTLAWNDFAALHKKWKAVVNGKVKDRAMRLPFSWLGGATSRSIDLGDITSIQPTPEDFQ